MTRKQQWFVLAVLAAMDLVFSVAVCIGPSDYAMTGWVFSLGISAFFVGAVMLS